MNLSNHEIIEVRIEADSPPYKNTAELRIFYDEKTSSWYAQYSGLKVQGQRGVVYDIDKGGKIKVPLEKFKMFEDYLKKTDKWYADKPKNATRPGSGHSWFIITIKSHDKNDKKKKIVTTVVEKWYFKDNVPSEEFKNVILKAGELFHNLDMTDIPKYD